MERHRFGNSDLTVSAIGLGCYGMSGVYGPADDAESIATIRRPLDSLQMEYSLLSRDAEEQGQIDACEELGMAMMAYAVLGRGMLSDRVPKVEELAADDVRQRLPRFQSVNIEQNLGLRSVLEAIARSKNATIAQLDTAWHM